MRKITAALLALCLLLTALNVSLAEGPESAMETPFTASVMIQGPNQPVNMGETVLLSGQVYGANKAYIMTWQMKQTVDGQEVGTPLCNGETCCLTAYGPMEIRLEVMSEAGEPVYAGIYSLCPVAPALEAAEAVMEEAVAEEVVMEEAAVYETAAVSETPAQAVTETPAAEAAVPEAATAPAVTEAETVMEAPVEEVIAAQSPAAAAETWVEETAAEETVDTAAAYAAAAPQETMPAFTEMVYQAVPAEQVPAETAVPAPAAYEAPAAASVPETVAETVTEAAYVQEPETAAEAAPQETTRKETSTASRTEWHEEPESLHQVEDSNQSMVITVAIGPMIFGGIQQEPEMAAQQLEEAEEAPAPEAAEENYAEFSEADETEETVIPAGQAAILPVSQDPAAPEEGEAVMPEAAADSGEEVTEDKEDDTQEVFIYAAAGRGKIEADPEQAEPTQAEEVPESTAAAFAELYVSIQSSFKGIARKGEIIHLTGVVTGAEGLEVSYQWECDQGSGFEAVEGATEAVYSFEADAQSLLWNWRLVVTCS